MTRRDRFEFASDNTATICPEAWRALAEANQNAVASYGDDAWTQRVAERMREIFETDCESFFVFNGTAANSLALAHLCRPFQSVLCHENSHIETDECGAPEFFSGGSKLLRVSGANGKLDLGDAAAVIARQRELHSPKPSALSITQSTELGTVYQPNELEAIAEFAGTHALHLHMDGARFANAVASLGCAPKEITWQRGIEVISLGGTKNGLAVGEIVVFFNREMAREFDYRAKQGAQLASKMRFIAAPWLALLSDDVWLRNAQHANDSAQKLVSQLDADLAVPTQANGIFLRLDEAIVRRLHARGWHFYRFIEPDIYRLMCSWSTSDAAIAEFVADFRQAQA